MMPNVLFLFYVYWPCSLLSSFQSFHGLYTAMRLYIIMFRYNATESYSGCNEQGCSRTFERLATPQISYPQTALQEVACTHIQRWPNTVFHAPTDSVHTECHRYHATGNKSWLINQPHSCMPFTLQLAQPSTFLHTVTQYHLASARQHAHTNLNKPFTSSGANCTLQGEYQQ